MKNLTLLALLFLALNAHAATSITTSSVAGHWTLAGSPYNVFNDIQVDASQSLIIDPGVSVIFQGSYRLMVTGILYAAGTATQQITFSVKDTTGFTTDTLTAAGGWHGIQFLPYSGTVTDTSVLKYCNVTYTKFDAGDCSVVPGLNALYIRRNITVSNCSFHDNMANTHPGLMELFYAELDTSMTATFDGCDFYNNFSGAAIVCFSFTSSNAIMHNCKVYQNRSRLGIITMFNGNLSITNSDIHDNVQYDPAISEGAILLNGNSSIKYNKIYNNVCQKIAAVSMFGGLHDIIGNIICNNYHVMGAGCGIVDGGGGLNLAWNSAIPHASTFYNVRNNIIANNYSPFMGGALKFHAANARVINNQVINNKSASAGAVYIFDNDTSSIAFKNNIFYGNTDDALTDTTSPVINAIIYDGSIEYDHNWQQRSTAFEMSVMTVHTVTISGDTTTDIVGSNPGLIAPTPDANVTTNAMTAKFGLLSTSACIDKGDTAGIITDSFDYAGNGRIYGSKIDMGAYEYSPLIGLSAFNTPAPEQQMDVFPNPAKSYIYVSVADAKGSLAILDISGRQVMQTKIVNTLSSFDIRNIEPGIYFVVWDNGNTSKTIRKIVIE